MGSTKTFHALYNDDDILLSAVKKIKEKHYDIDEVYTPFPVHGLDKVMGLEPTRIAIAAFIYGCIGITVATLMMNYIMIVDWPQNIGGKPSFSYIENMPAFVPIMFEMTVFHAAHLMVITFYLRSRLWPFKTAENPIPETTDDKFLIQIPINGNEKKIKLILEKTDLFKIDIVKSDNEKEDLEIKDNVLHNVRDKETTVSIGFVFQSRKYSDGSSNLRVQFTQGKGMQYAKNTGLKIFRKHWISSKCEVSSKHDNYEKVNSNLDEIKSRINLAKIAYTDGEISFDDLHKNVLNK